MKRIERKLDRKNILCHKNVTRCRRVITFPLIPFLYPSRRLWNWTSAEQPKTDLNFRDSICNHNHRSVYRVEGLRLVYLNSAWPKNERLPNQYLKRCDINPLSELCGMNREKHQVSILHCTARQTPFRMPLVSFVRHDGGARERGKGTKAQRHKAEKPFRFGPLFLFAFVPVFIAPALLNPGPEEGGEGL